MEGDRRGAFIVCTLVVLALLVMNVARLVELDALGAAFDLVVTLAVLAGLGYLYWRARRAERDPS